MKTLYLDQVGGVSGDMFLGLLVGLGVDRAALESAIQGLGAGPIRIVVDSVARGGLPATRVQVLTGDDHEHHHHEHHHNEHHHHEHHHGPEGHHHVHRGLVEITRILEESTLPRPVVANALRVFRRLGEAEAFVHGVALEDVHFHEVGALDSIADIVGVCWGLHALGVKRILSSPFVLGQGLVRMAHGTWPVPAPATLRLLEGHPVRWTALEGETVTPTGAALVVTLAEAIGEVPLMTLGKAAAGAGTREWPDRPNVLRGFLAETMDAGEEVCVLEAAIDDMTPEAAAYLATSLMSAGALDVVLVPAIMKKGRPGFQITILTRPGDSVRLGDVLFRESSTLGIRQRMEKRRVLEREIIEVVTPWGAVRVKVAVLPDGRKRLAPEYEDCARLARESGSPLYDVMEAARRAAVAATS